MTDKREAANKLAKLFFATDTGSGGNANTDEAKVIKAELGGEAKSLMTMAMTENAGVAGTPRHKLWQFIRDNADIDVYNNYVARCGDYSKI